MSWPTRNDALRRFLDAPGRFGVYGTGRDGEDVLEALAQQGLKPQVFLDGDRRGELRGLEIVAPEEALDRALDAVVTAGRHARDMTAQLRADGFEGPVLDLTRVRDPRLAGHFDGPRLEAAGDAIAFARSLFRDDGSREILDRLLAHRRSLDPGDLPPETPAYRHPAAPIREGDWVLDVGAGDGETTLGFAEAAGPLGRVHAFEPDDRRRELLLQATSSSALGARITVHALACGKASVEPSDGDEDGARAVALDDFVWDHTAGRVTWLKLDVPDAREALAGATAILTELRPRLALCLQHRPDDLWELPIRLKERVPGYRLHLGHHAQNLDHTVCYADAAS